MWHFIIHGWMIVMSEEDLLSLINESSMSSYFSGLLSKYPLITVYMMDGEEIDIGQGGVRKEDVQINQDSFTVFTNQRNIDYMYNAIIKIQKYGVTKW